MNRADGHGHGERAAALPSGMVFRTLPTWLFLLLAAGLGTP